MKFNRNLLALLVALALFGAACGSSSSDGDNTGDESSGDESSGEDSTGDEDSGDEDTGEEDSGEDSTGDESSGSAAIDLDAVLDVDLNACDEAPSGDPVVVGMAMDFGEVSGYADVPGSKAAEHLADLINCSGGFDGSPIEVVVKDIQGDIEVTSQAAP